jgi:C-terminal processing protease CtpA/Prc
MWVLKFHGETLYVNHVECQIPWSTKETPDNPHTKGSIKVKDCLLRVDSENCATITQLTVIDKFRLRNQKLGITRIMFQPGPAMGHRLQ